MTLNDLPLSVLSQIRDWDRVTKYDMDTGQPLEGVCSPWIISFYDPDTGKPWRETRLWLWGPRKRRSVVASINEHYRIYGDPLLLLWFNYQREERRTVRWWRRLFTK